MLLSITAKSQSWQPGRFYDIKGTKNTGFIRIDPRGKGPIKGEGFIEYKEDEKAETIKLSASDLRSFVAGRDSFVVAVAPTQGWAKYDLDFVRVAVDGPLRLFEAKGSAGDGSGVGLSPGIGVGMAGGGGTGGFGGGLGGGISIPIGGGSRGRSGKAVYYYGANTASMKPLTNENFIDVMTEIMGDEPDVVEKIQTKKFSLRDINKLLTYFYQVQAAHGQ
ncbi:hypothetical protein [Mucilaginibacter panaciglaebae]|uniref:Uncharacterized protein n=1 Tax=Mucilaginibacter panaciglaebae TaxID=502331 RepID=A0ABP7WCB7_9SPHI